MSKSLLIYFALMIIVSITNAQHKIVALSDPEYDKIDKSKAVIKGKIINATKEELKAINIQYAMVNITEPLQTTFRTKVSDDGLFLIEQNQNLPYQQVWFSFDKYAYTCLYLHDGLDITFDLEKLKQKSVFILGDGMVFGGKDAILNQSMNEYILFVNQHNADFNKQVNSLNSEDKDYIQKLASLYAIQRKIDKNFTTENSDYDFLIQANTNAQYNYRLLSYYLQNDIKAENLSSLLTPIYSISNDTGNYIRFLRYYMHSLYSIKYPGTIKNYAPVFDFIDSILAKNFSEIIKLNFDDKDIITQNNIYKEALLSSKSNWAKRLLQQEIENLNKKEKEIKDLLAANIVNKESDLGTLINSLPFNANLYLDKSADGNSLLKEIKASFPNKLIILDIWATWCVPCLEQMPASKQLHDLVHQQNLPIEFVYLCTDRSSDRAKWENKIAELKQPGTHLFVNNKNISELFQLFNRGGYPTYVAIKPNGEIDTKSISWINQLKIEDLKKMLE